MSRVKFSQFAIDYGLSSHCVGLRAPILGFPCGPGHISQVSRFQQILNSPFGLTRLTVCVSDVADRSRFEIEMAGGSFQFSQLTEHLDRFIVLSEAGGYLP